MSEGISQIFEQGITFCPSVSRKNIFKTGNNTLNTVFLKAPTMNHGWFFVVSQMSTGCLVALAENTVT